jgi:hypothetical protein
MTCRGVAILSKSNSPSPFDHQQKHLTGPETTETEAAGYPRGLLEATP